MEEDECNVSLGLAIGGGGYSTSNQSRDGGRKPPVQFHILFPPRPKGEEEEEEPTIEERPANKSGSKNIDEEEDTSTNDVSGGVSCNQAGKRKKLRLTKQQLTLLENSFQEHSTLNPPRKQELADQLNLRPRQVEVWFQNRRARTKSKQTELDREFLNKCCENLSNENQRLKRELEELKSMKPGCPFYVGIPKVATLTLCPSCERTMAAGGQKGIGALDVMKSLRVPVNNGLVGL
ncbi:homeobox-leucine zipper protein HAT22-like [Phoenix dactylifera]|uniref:Homeobox-leucine zipper protein HAT22-like n=1 Tax=Phoenix dactylifera TaxID=42345 RepID=A0A8B7BN31_PHODC|nr:homeobox-leucine zipper protein HAT22-like [Phoenix dactylifera]